MGKALSVVVIMGVAVMMIFSILPAYALHDAAGSSPPDDGSHCHGESRSPWVHNTVNIENQFELDLDANSNGFYCFNGRSNMFQDDVVPRVR